MAYFPFMIDISNQKCLVVGGGTIAFHKVKILEEFDVHIQVVAKEISEELQQLADSKREFVEIIKREFQDGDIDGMDVVVAATDDAQLNCHISNICKQKNILINAVDMPAECSFIFPAIIKDNNMLIAVSSGGKCPAAAAYVKKTIKQAIPDYYKEMIDNVGQYRADILERVDTARKRKEVFNKMLEYGDNHEGNIPEAYVNMLIEEAGK